MIGRVISHYRVQEKLGEGGMGVVYKAEDLKLKRPVALKFLPEGALTEQQRQRFLREAQAAASLQHAGICTVYEVDEADGKVFFAMAYVEGRPLSKVLRQGPLELRQILDIAVQIAEALAEAHSRGVVHRDVKASNVMITPGGKAVILDFGLAQIGGEAGLTRTGVTVGTAAYMSPEQAQGAAVDRRTDLWSLGVVLYEMLTGRLPFRGEYDLAVMYNIVNEAPPPIRVARTDASADLEAVCARALSKRPEDRYQSASEFLSDLYVLRTAVDSTDVASTIVSATAAWHQKKRWRSALAVTALAALLAALGGLAWRFSQPADTPPDRAAAPTSIPAQKHLAILPFESTGPNPNDAAFAAGLVEILTAKLTELEQFQGDLFVVPASEIRAEAVASVAQARQNFNVNLAITGSIHRSNDRLRLSANLVDAPSLRQLRSVSLDLTSKELDDLLDGVVRRVVGLLELELNVEARAALSDSGSREPRAYEHYLRGLGYLQRYDQEGNVDKAIESLNKAIDADPDYAPAHAKLGEAYWQLYEVTADVALADQALAAARQAVESNDRLAVAHATLGKILWQRLGETEEAEAHFDRALELDPLNADARRDLAGLYRVTGKQEQAEALFERAIELRPNDWRNYSSLGVYYYSERRWEEAEKAFLKAIELTPDNQMSHRNLAGVYLATEQYDDARAELQKSIEIQPSAKAYSNLGFVEYVEGRYEEAASAFEAAVELRPNNYILHGNLGDAYRRIPGSAARARQAYQKAVEAAKERLAVNPQDVRPLQKLALYSAKMGDREGARSSLARIPDEARQTPPILLIAAVVQELAGERDEAFATLRLALERGLAQSKIEAEPELEALRADDRYKLLAGQTDPTSPTP